MNTYHLSIGGIGISLETDQNLDMTESFAPFRDDCVKPRYRAVFHREEEIPPIPEEVVSEGVSCRIHPDGRGGFLRSFFNAPKDMVPYSLVTYDYANGIIDIPYLERGSICVSQMSNSFYHIGLEGILIREDRLSYHAACVDTPLGAILFAGPSGAGKSTQSGLWCKHRSGRLINGDRPILSLDGDKVLAWGSPYAGSSKCYVNENCWVSAIVLLKQAPVCGIRKLGLPEAVRRIYAGLNVHTYDRFFLNRACDLVMEIAARVPVYEFACTADEAAVAFLENALKEGMSYDDTK